MRPAHFVQAEEADLALGRGLQGALVGGQRRGEVRLEIRDSINTRFRTERDIKRATTLSFPLFGRGQWELWR